MIILEGEIIKNGEKREILLKLVFSSAIIFELSAEYSRDEPELECS